MSPFDAYEKASAADSLASTFASIPRITGSSDPALEIRTADTEVERVTGIGRGEGFQSFARETSNRPNILGDDQDIDLLEQALEPIFELPEELLRLAVRARDNFDFDNIFDEIYAAIVPSSLIRRGLGANRSRAKNVDQFFANAGDFLRFDLGAVVILQWQIDLVLFHTASDAFARPYNKR